MAHIMSSLKDPGLTSIQLHFMVLLSKANHNCKPERKIMAEKEEHYSMLSAFTPSFRI